MVVSAERDADDEDEESENAYRNRDRPVLDRSRSRHNVCRIAEEGSRGKWFSSGRGIRLVLSIPPLHIAGLVKRPHVAGQLGSSLLRDAGLSLGRRRCE